MNITLTITTDSVAELANIAAALAGNAPAAAPAPAATVTRGKSPKAETTTATAQPSIAAAAEAPAPEKATATTATTEPAAPVEVTDADLMAAANAAVMKVGPGAQAKVKAYIAEKFQQEDGSPAGLKTVKAAQKAGLLADLQSIGQGGIVL